MPVVVDAETTGINPNTDGLLELAMVLLDVDSNGQWVRSTTLHEHVIPFPGANINPEAMKINQIKIEHPFRFALNEAEALNNLFQPVQDQLKRFRCQRAVLVGHNAWFDLLFMKAACDRAGLKKIPFHKFTAFDTATLAGLIYGQTVLAKACSVAKIPFDQDEAHSAIYDAEKTADLFCQMLNGYDALKTASQNS